MKLIVGLILIFVTFAQAERDWSKIFARNLPDPLHGRLAHGIPLPRITGGEEASPHSLPHQAALFLPVEGGTAFCGGSLISRRTILTAAHCVDSLVDSVEIILGAHRIQEVEASQVTRRSSRVLVHPNWSSSTLRNDLALVSFDQPVELSAQIQLIDYSRDSSNSFEGHEATVSGWGLASDSSTSISPILRRVTVPVISNSVCNLAFLGVIQTTHICTSGRDGKSTCSGDSGGALFVAGQQIGIVSFGLALGCEIGFPAAYTRVSAYHDWIRDNLL